MFFYNSSPDAAETVGLPLARLSRPLLFFAGASVFIWALFSPNFRDAENSLTGQVCVPFSLSAVCFILSLTLDGRWRAASLWFGMAVIAQAAIFQITYAGPALHYQHLKPASEILTGVSPLVWGFLIFQAALVAGGIFRRRRQIFGWLKANFRPWQAGAVFAAFFICSATVSEDPRFYIYELILAGTLQTINLGNIVLAVAAIPESAAGSLKKLKRFLTGADEAGKIEPAGPDRFVLSLAFFVFLLAALLNVFSYEKHPHIPDEVAYLTQARFFAAGELTRPAPPVREAFEIYLMEINGDRWYPVTPPGWALILALGVLAGAAWLVNPVLAALNLILTYVLLRELYPKPTARLAVLLLCFSPWYIFIGMSFMTHMAALAAALLAALGVVLARRKQSAGWAWAGGFALGFISLIRPLEAVAVAGLLGLWAIGFGGKRLKWTAVAGLVLGAMIVGAANLYHNAALTGDPLKIPIMEYTDRHFGKNSNAYGFGPDRGMSWSLDPNPGHGPFDALVNSNLNISTLNTELFGWSTGSFLLLFVFLLAGRFQQSDHLMLAVKAAVYILHFFYYYSGGPDFSARYWFLMVVPLVALSARGVEVLAAKLDNSSKNFSPGLYAALAALCLTALINFVPWRAIDKYHNFRGMRPDIRRLAAGYDFGRSLVLIRPEKGAFHFPDYDSAMIYNPPDLENDEPVYALDRGPETRKKLAAAFPDRPVWIVNSPSATGRGYEVAFGPLSPEDFLNEIDRELK